MWLHESCDRLKGIGTSGIYKLNIPISTVVHNPRISLELTCRENQGYT